MTTKITLSEFWQIGEDACGFDKKCDKYLESGVFTESVTDYKGSVIKKLSIPNIKELVVVDDGE